MMRRLPALPVLIAAALALAASEGRAQRFVGAVQLPGGAGPAAGVLVAAEDSTGRTIAESITLDDGSFALFVDSTATVTLRLFRPGAPAVEVARRRLGDGQVDTVRHALAAAAPTLAGAIDRGSSTCRDRRTGKEPVHLLLEEARVTMRIAQLRAGREDAAARFVRFNHRTAKNGEDTLYTLMRREQGALPAVFEPVSTEQLEAGGFFGTVAGERVFRAPDLELLLSDWFHETHCFTLRKVTADSLILSFAPTRERKGLVDVEGEYVFDRRSLELREVTYRYQGLPSHERQSGAGGRIVFARAPNGNRFAAEWHQRVPILGYRQADGTTTFVRSEMTLIDITGHRTVGGRVLATLFRGRPTWQRDALVRPASATPFGQLCSERVVTAATGAVRGRLVSDSGEALQGVLVKASWHVNVVIDRTQMAQREQVREAVTDAEGRWVLCDIPVRRDVTVRYEVRGEERSIPVTLEEPMALLELPAPGTP